MRVMRSLPIAAVVCVSCVEEPPPHHSRAAVPIKSACTATSLGAASVGLDVRAGRRHSDAQTISVTNTSSEPRTVRVEQVSRVEGPCSAEWSRQTPLNFLDARTGEPPAETTLLPNQAFQLQIGPQRVNATWDCTKLGLALWLDVGGTRVCSDAGAWVTAREGEGD